MGRAMAVLLCIVLASCQQASDLYAKVIGRAQCHDDGVTSTVRKMIGNEIMTNLAKHEGAAALAPSIFNEQTTTFDLIVDVTPAGAKQTSCTAQLTVVPLPGAIPAGPLIGGIALIQGLFQESVSLYGINAGRNGRTAALDNRPEVIEGESIRWDISYDATLTSDRSNTVVYLDKEKLQGISTFLATYINENSKVSVAVTPSEKTYSLPDTDDGMKEVKEAFEAGALQPDACHVHTADESQATIDIENEHREGLEANAPAGEDVCPKVAQAQQPPAPMPDYSAWSEPQKAEFDRWTSELMNKILANWKQFDRPDVFDCNALIKMTNSGEIESVELGKSCGNSDANEGLLKAIRTLVPLPIPADPSVFTPNLDMRLTN